MKKILFIFLGILVLSCSTNPDYQNNLKLAKKWVQAFEKPKDFSDWKKLPEIIEELYE